MAKCHVCHGFGQWWECQSTGGELVRFYGCGLDMIPPAAVHYICTDCLGGIIHCCGGEQAQAGDDA